MRWPIVVTIALVATVAGCAAPPVKPPISAVTVQRCVGVEPGGRISITECASF